VGQAYAGAVGIHLQSLQRQPAEQRAFHRFHAEFSRGVAFGLFNEPAGALFARYQRDGPGEREQTQDQDPAQHTKEDTQQEHQRSGPIVK